MPDRRRPAGDAVADFAPAKVNLTLRVLGRRADGYHELESVVAFADAGDRLTFAPGGELAIAVGGPTAEAAGPDGDNLVLKAARALAARVPGLVLGRFVLSKRLPVAAGLGGGSSDAAAALRLLARHNGLAADDPRLAEAAVATGADVTVCLDPRARIMRGIGERLSPPLPLSPLAAVLVNPRIAVPTREVFAGLKLAPGMREAVADPADAAGLSAMVADVGNDLEPPALAVAPVIGTVLDELRTLPGVTLARMSGSGATCFALFSSRRAATAGARALRAKHPGWWVRATVLR